jgi:hypothetical protein
VPLSDPWLGATGISVENATAIAAAAVGCERDEVLVVLRAFLGFMSSLLLSLSLLLAGAAFRQLSRCKTAHCGKWTAAEAAIRPIEDTRNMLNDTQKS